MNCDFEFCKYYAGGKCAYKLKESQCKYRQIRKHGCHDCLYHGNAEAVDIFCVDCHDERPTKWTALK